MGDGKEKGDLSRNDGSGRFCRRCLTRDMIGQEEYFANLQEYIRNLDRDIKTASQEYESRLAVCKGCDMLFQGMCRSCGCYVELRAAIARNACPNRRW